MNKLTDKIWFWISLLILLLLPFLILSFFCHPSADDFIVSSYIRERGISGHLHQIYYEWSGRYFSSFIKCFNPLVYGWLWGYKLIPFTLIILFYFSIYYFISSIFASDFSTIKKHLLALVIVLLYFNSIPSTSECIYWMDSSLNYFLGSAFVFFFFGALVKSFYTEKKRGLVFILLILPILAIGSNEISMLAVDEMLALIFLYFIIRRRKIHTYFLVTFIIAIISTVAEMTAPGNYTKMIYFPENMNLIFSLQQSVMAFFKIAVKFIIDPAFILVTVLYAALLPLFYKNRIFKSLVELPPFYIIPISLLIMLSMYFFTIYSTGLNPALRIHNAVGLFFVFAWFYNIAVMHNFLVRRFKTESPEVPSYLVKLMAAAAVVFAVTQFSKEPGKEIVCEGNIFHSYYDLFNNAVKYNNELTQREDEIKQAVNQNNKILGVEPLSAIPETIHFMDITSDPMCWVNLSEAEYFGLDSIKVIAKDSLK